MTHVDRTLASNEVHNIHNQVIALLGKLHQFEKFYQLINKHHECVFCIIRTSCMFPLASNNCKQMCDENSSNMPHFYLSIPET